MLQLVPINIPPLTPQSEKFIPESKFDLHEAYCFRNIKRCPKCNVPVDKAEMNDHEAAIHKLVDLSLPLLPSGQL